MSSPNPGASPGGVVTPEAVLLEFETAGVGSRTAAELLDVTIQLVALGLVLMAASLVDQAVGGGTGTVAVIIVLVLAFLVILGYPVVMESLWNGRTLGKAALGLRVVTVEGGPVRFRHAAIRSIFGLFELWITFGSVAVLAVILTPRDQRLGDLSAGTLVLRERTARSAHTVAVSFPPPYGYEGYVASLDVSGLSADQYAVVRTFLVRVLDLTPEARASVAVSVANKAALALHHTPPPGVPAELFLVCVAAAYQQRHGAPAPSAPGWGAPPPPAPGWAAPPAPAPGWGPPPAPVGPAPAPGWGPPPTPAGPAPSARRPPRVGSAPDTCPPGSRAGLLGPSHRAPRASRSAVGIVRSAVGSSGPPSGSG